MKQTGQLGRTVFFIYISVISAVCYGEHRIEKGKVLPYNEAIHLAHGDEGPEPIPEHAVAGEKKVRRPVANIDLALI